MKTTLLTICLFLACVAIFVEAEATRLHEESYYKSKFEEFKQQFHRNYADAEEEKYIYLIFNIIIYRKRLEIFSENLDKIETHNAKKDSSFKMGVNKFSDMTSDEFKKNHMGYLNKDKPTVSGAN